MNTFATTLKTWNEATVNHYSVVDLSDQEIKRRADTIAENEIKELENNFFEIIFCDGSSVSYEKEQA